MKIKSKIQAGWNGAGYTAYGNNRHVENLWKWHDLDVKYGAQWYGKQYRMGEYNGY